MTQKYVAKNARSHTHNLSINSISSLSEPSTPPAAASSAKSCIWNENKLSDDLVLPTFNLNPQLDLSQAQKLSHTRKFSDDSAVSDKENHAHTSGFPPKSKIDKAYLAAIAKVPLDQLSDDILRLAKDQHGCRFLQKRIDDHVVPNAQAREANFQVIFSEIEGSFYELIIDPFGNYLIQKLIQFFTDANLDSILKSLRSNLFSISINQHGTRALQKIIDKIGTPDQYDMLVQGLKPYIIELIKDLNGNHVIQRVLNKYTSEECQFVYDAILEDLLVVATHKHGCCVLQKCLNHVSEAQHEAFARVILSYDNFVRLVNDQFGNYVLQYLISVNSVEVNRELYRNFVRFGLEDLCVLKFSSNVIEKLMKNCFNNEPASVAFTDLKFIIIGHILTCDLNKLINDPYGNYVVQTLIDIMINPTGASFVTTATGERVLLPSLRMLLAPDYHLSSDPLQIQIIKSWFANCRIVSSFGKRIQSKINMLVNGSGRSYNRRYTTDYTSYAPRNSFTNYQAYPNQGHSNQGHPNQAYPNQSNPNQGHSNQGQFSSQRSLSYGSALDRNAASQFRGTNEIQATLHGSQRDPFSSSNFQKNPVIDNYGHYNHQGPSYVAVPREHHTTTPATGMPQGVAMPGSNSHLPLHSGPVMANDVSFRNVQHYDQPIHFSSEDFVSRMGSLQLDNHRARESFDTTYRLPMDRADIQQKPFFPVTNQGPSYGYEQFKS